VSIVNGQRWNVRSSDGSLDVVRSGWDFDLAVAAVPGWDAFPFAFQTTNDVPVVQTFAQLPSDGAAVLFMGRVQAVQNGGENGQYAFQEGIAARNADGVGIRSPIVGGDAWTPPGAPWVTIAAPGWTMVLAELAGNAVQLRMAGLAGQVINWSGVILRRFVGSAIA
jgi:hypothetical protein